jgi:5-methylcytosine-specific restriction endonuclease McrA
VKALALEGENKTKAKLARAHALMAQVDVLERTGRQPIPDDVKMFVWQRDGGKCVRCGSNRNLEFDHIIPVVMGGANTARNLQLLCEGCNRAKSGSLV